ncbi:MAG: hypothetical protein ACE5DQ_02500 [Candidatus Paceibacterota bacterium]
MEEGGEEFVGRGDQTTQSKRLRAVLRLNLEAVIGNAGDISVSGKEHLAQIPEGTHPVISVNQTSDVNLQIAAYVLDQLDPLITSMSTNYQLPASLLIKRDAFKEYFAPLQWRKSDGRVVPVFDPDDYAKIEAAVLAGKTPFVAAHNPTYEGKLPKSGGLAAVYLAHKLGDRIVVPVAVWLDDRPGEPAAIMGEWKHMIKYLRNRPSAFVAVGEPQVLEPVNIEAIERFYQKRNKHERLTQGEREKFSTAKKMLQEQSRGVMTVIAEMMPKSKRGPWKKEEPTG